MIKAALNQVAFIICKKNQNIYSGYQIEKYRNNQSEELILKYERDPFPK